MISFTLAMAVGVRLIGALVVVFGVVVVVAILVSWNTGSIIQPCRAKSQAVVMSKPVQVLDVARRAAVARWATQDGLPWLRLGLKITAPLLGTGAIILRN
jgi:hypothetical protein